MPSNGRITLNNQLDNIRIHSLPAQNRTRHPKYETVLSTLQWNLITSHQKLCFTQAVKNHFN